MSEYFKRCFPVGKKSYTVRLPAEIMKSDDERIIRGSLRDLFSSDGSFSFRKKDLDSYLQFHSKNKELRDQFIELASRLGFDFRAYDPKHRDGVIRVADLGRKYVVGWMEQIGTTCDTHIKTFET